MDGWVSELVVGWMDVCCLDGWMGGVWMKGKKEGWLGELMDRCMGDDRGRGRGQGSGGE